MEYILSSVGLRLHQHIPPYCVVALPWISNPAIRGNLAILSGWSFTLKKTITQESCAHDFVARLVPKFQSTQGFQILAMKHAVENADLHNSA